MHRIQNNNDTIVTASLTVHITYARYHDLVCIIVRLICMDYSFVYIINHFSHIVIENLCAMNEDVFLVYTVD